MASTLKNSIGDLGTLHWITVDHRKGMDSTLKNSIGGVADDDAKVRKEWYERKCNVEMLGSTEEALFAELDFTSNPVRMDPRNKYFWSHRQWTLEKLGRGYADELGLCDNIITYGLRHNTHNRLIWDQRCFAVQKCLAKGMTIIRSCESTVAADAILMHPEDENPWRYLRLLYKNDMKALAQNNHLRWALINIFMKARMCANAVRADKVMYEHHKHAQLLDSVNKRACLFALDLLSDLLKHEHQPDDEVKEAFDDVFQEYSGNTFAEKVDSVLREHRLELMELCTDYTRMIIDIKGGMETTPAFVFEDVIPEQGSTMIGNEWDGAITHILPTPSPFFPRSELGLEAGFKPACFIPDDPKWLAYMKSSKSSKEERRSWSMYEVTEDDHKDKYSVLPEYLRNSWRKIDTTYSDSELIDFNSHLMFCHGRDSPSVWQLRRLAIHVRGFSLENELEALELLGKTTIIDNYLFWHHRRWVSEKIGSDAAASNELEFTAKVLSEFPYNYHAWFHRQLVHRVFGKEWGMSELDYCNKILKEDASNCFAWNQRYFVLREHPNWHETRTNEVQYAIGAIHAEPENEMPWMYLTCLVSGKYYKVINASSTCVLSKVVKHHIKEGKVDIHDAYVKKRVVNALNMVLLAVKRNGFKPNHDLKTNIDSLCPPEAAEKSYAEKVVSILRSMDVTWM